MAFDPWFQSSANAKRPKQVQRMSSGSRNNMRKDVMLLQGKQAATLSVGEWRDDLQDRIQFQVETDDSAESELFVWNTV